MWPPDWTGVKTVAVSATAAVSAIFGVIQTLRRGRLDVLVWSGITAVLIGVLAVEAYWAVCAGSVVLLRWTLRTWINNVRRIGQEGSRHVDALVDYPYGHLQIMNRWLVVATPCLIVACVSIPFAPGVAFLPAVVGVLSARFGASQGLQARTGNVASDDDDAGQVSLFLFSHYFPSSWGERSGRRFAPYSYVMLFVALILTASLLSHPWQQLTDDVNDYVGQRIWPDDSKDNEDDEPESDSPPAVPSPTGDPQPSTDLRPPPECAADRLADALAGAGVRSREAARVLAARARYSWPIIGCRLSDVSRASGSLHVVYGGPDGSALVVDDGRAANAVVSTAAEVLQGQLRAPRTADLVSVSAGARAALGRWHLETWSDGSCQLLESRDKSLLVRALTFADTVRVARRAERLGAFPMIADTLGGGVEIQFVATDPRSPNGYRVVASGRFHGPPVAGRAPSCAQLLQVLLPLGNAVEQAAHAHGPS